MEGSITKVNGRRRREEDTKIEEVIPYKTQKPNKISHLKKTKEDSNDKIVDIAKLPQIGKILWVRAKNGSIYRVDDHDIFLQLKENIRIVVTITEDTTDSNLPVEVISALKGIETLTHEATIPEMKDLRGGTWDGNLRVKVGHWIFRVPGDNYKMIILFNAKGAAGMMVLQGEIILTEEEANGELMIKFKKFMADMKEGSVTVDIIISDLKIMGADGGMKSFRLSSTSDFISSPEEITGGLIPHLSISRGELIQFETVTELIIQSASTQINYTWTTENGDKKSGRSWLISDFKTKRVSEIMRDKNDEYIHHVSLLKTWIEDKAGQIFYTLRKTDKGDFITVLGINAYSFPESGHLSIFC